MPNPSHVLGNKPRYDDLGRSHYNFVFWTQEPNPNGAPGSLTDSAHLPLFSFFANWSELRWGHLSGPWLETRRAIGGGWCLFERTAISPEQPPEKYFVRGSKQRDQANFKTKEMKENFIQYAVEDNIYPFDTTKGYWNLDPVRMIAQPLSAGNVWAFKRVIALASSNAIISGGQIQKHPNRTMWFNGPPIDDLDTPPDDGGYAANRAKFYALAAGEKNKGRIVQWAIE